MKTPDNGKAILIIEYTEVAKLSSNYRWMPDTGGANVPALNELLSEFGIVLGDSVLEGYFAMGDHSMYYASGTSLIRFPQGNGSILIERDLHDQGLEVCFFSISLPSSVSLLQIYRFQFLQTDQIKLEDNYKIKAKFAVPILGMLQTNKKHLKHNRLPVVMQKTINDETDLLMDKQHLNELNDTGSFDKTVIINKRVLLNSENERNLKFNNADINENLKKFDRLNEIDTPATIGMAGDKNVAAEEIDQHKQKYADVASNGTVDDTAAAAVADNLIELTARQPAATEGRIVVYGDSNCLDSTHLEKPCYWLLDAFLEYTMTAHVPGLLTELNRSAKVKFSDGMFNLYFKYLLASGC